MSMAPLQTPQRGSSSSSSSGGISAVTPFKTPHRTPGGLGEQTSQTPIVNFDTIERQKENVAPSARGRSAHSLSQTLGLEHKQRMDKLNQERKQWEERVTQESLEEADDPLDVWNEYIKWVVENYPSGGSSSDSGLVPLLERATRTLMQDKRNHQLHKYLNMWIRYSRMVDNPEHVLAWLIANGIGTEVAALYEEAAAVSYARGLYESADSLYNLGLRREARPAKRLLDSYEKFQKRIVDQQQSQSSSGALLYKDALAQAMKYSRRTMLGTKDERTGRSHSANVVNGRAGQSAGLLGSHRPAVLPNNGRKLDIFSDADGAESGAGRGPTSSFLSSRQVHRQENTKDATKWGGERLPQSSQSKQGGKKAPLQVFADSDNEDDGETASPSKKKDPFALSSKPTLGSQCLESDRLKKDPFGKWEDNKVKDQVDQLKVIGLSDIHSLAAQQRQAPSAPSGKDQIKKSSTSGTSKSKPATSAPSSSKSRQPSSSKSKTASSTRVASGGKLPERLAIPEHLLYPGAQAGTASCTGQQTEMCMEEIMAERLGFSVHNAGGDDGEDPWGYLDSQEEEEVEQLSMVQEQDEEEDDQIDMSLSVAPAPRHSSSEQEGEDEEPDATVNQDAEEERPSAQANSNLHAVASTSREGSSTPTRAEVATAMPSRATSITPTQSPVVLKSKPARQSSKAHADPPREETRHLASPTMMTKAAEAEIRALFNGGDEGSESESEGTDCTTSDDEDDEQPQRVAAPAVPPTPTPAGRNLQPLRSVDENVAAVKATPLRPSGGQRTALGSLPTATPMRKPLGNVVAATPLGGTGKKGVFVEEDEDDQPETSPVNASGSSPVNTSASSNSRGPSAKRVLHVAHDEEDEESDPEEEYEYEEAAPSSDGANQGNAAFAPHELTTITERTEYETRWGMATPGRSKIGLQPPNEEDEDEEEQGESSVRLGEHSDGPSFSSGGTKATPSRAQTDPSQFGGKARFNLSPGYTIEQREEHTSRSSDAVLDGVPNPCSPTDADVIALVLNNLARPIESSPDYHDLTSERSEQLALIKKQLGKCSRKSLNSSSVGTASVDVVISGITFTIREMLGEGAYGSVFLAEDIENRIPPRGGKQLALGGIAGDDESILKVDDCDGDADDEEDEDSDDEDEAERKRMVAIKVETPPNKWEFYILGQMRARLESRALQSIISARRFFAYQDESYLVLEWGEKGTLLEIVNQASQAGVAPSGSSSGKGATGVEEVLAIFFAVELLRLVENLHRNELIHGDLKIDNCLLRLEELPTGTTWTNTYHSDGSNGWSQKGLYLLDFGRAIDMRPFSPDQRFIADWEVDPTKDCLEIRLKKSWNYEIDYYGIASIVHVLLFGKYMTTQKSSAGEQELLHAPFKRYWQVELWTEFFTLLLNPNKKDTWPMNEDLSSMRMKFQDWLQENSFKSGKNLKGLLKKLEIWSMRS
ncbi:unnamed protein product [Sympodiomycopsis kandeliae]